MLCESARSQNAELRINSLWALKHAVDGMPIKAKKGCMEELMPGWLVRLISDDADDEALATTQKNDEDAMPDMDDDVEMRPAEESSRSWGVPLATNGKLEAKMTRYTERLDALRDEEFNPARRARGDDVAVQEQALNFIRNLICISPHSTDAQDSHEMIDYLFNEIGRERLFEILAAKLKPRPASSWRGASKVYAPARIVSAVIFILVHIANSGIMHKQNLCAQKCLMELVLQHSEHSDRQVRAAFCSLVSNLTTEASDPSATRQKRAFDLKQLGYVDAVSKLKNGDRDLDIRESAELAYANITNSGY